jgi:phosphatidylethanolamine/phosphatidyl-N-methylethanolamine N-methyltransferase
MSENEAVSKESILAEYYEKFYHSLLHKNSCQSFGTRYFDRRLENSWVDREYVPKKLLEVGFASGEHVSKVKSFPSEEYVGLDINAPATFEYIDALPKEARDKLKLVKSDAANMPFEDSSFDRVVATCLLHHVNEPLKVLQEIRRVTRNGGEVSIGLPTDPGMLNRLIKTFVTYPSMRKLGVASPKTIYALEHPNQVGGLIELARFIFKDDRLKLTYSPFRLPTWNFNLMVVIQVQITK